MINFDDLNLKTSLILAILIFMSNIILCSTELSMKKVGGPRGRVGKDAVFQRS